MKNEPLQKAVKLLGRVSNNTSMTTLFQCIELGPEAMRACSEYGNIEYWVSVEGVSTPVLVNTLAFAAVVNSIGPNDEIIFNQTPNQLNWKAGAAKGHLSYPSAPQPIPTIPADRNFSWKPPKDFPTALSLASTACQAVSVTIGLFGVVFEPLSTGRLRMTSSNNNSLATTQVVLDGYPTGETITLRPPVPTILAAMIEKEPEAMVDVGKDGIFIVSPSFVAHLPLSSPLGHSVGQVIDRFNVEATTTAIDAKAISVFLGRAKALTDKNLPVEIRLQVSEGKLILNQISGAASTEQYFLASGIDPSRSFASVVLPFGLLAPSLEHTQLAILDYLPSNILVLRGNTPDFRHIIGGKAS
jgi:hypothetical protein